MMILVVEWRPSFLVLLLVLAVLPSYRVMALFAIASSQRKGVAEVYATPASDYAAFPHRYGAGKEVLLAGQSPSSRTSGDSHIPCTWSKVWTPRHSHRSFT